VAASTVATHSDFDRHRRVAGSTHRTLARYGFARPSPRDSTSDDNDTPAGGVDSHPRPAQRPVPVVMGGHSAVAHRRAAALADGWYGWMLGLRTTAEQVAALRRAVDRSRRPLHVSVTPARRLNPDLVRDFARMGVDRLVVAPPPNLALPELEAFIEANAPDALGASPALPQGAVREPAWTRWAIQLVVH
jgi:alkanesulfonate monooxygenase SsuD/methylene tetrahydromethanopterin reductase-like flavin-dependent oxidoreductase (luciferase family)